MKIDASLVQQIENARSMSINHSLVTYDMRDGVDFSHPGKTAHALAKVLFEEDAKYWFKMEGKELQFKPDYKAELLLPNKHMYKITATLNDFLNDLKDDEILPEFKEQVESSVNLDGWSGYMFMSLSNNLFNNLESQQADRNRFLHHLLLEVMTNIKIEYLD